MMKVIEVLGVTLYLDCYRVVALSQKLLMIPLVPLKTESSQAYQK